MEHLDNIGLVCGELHCVPEGYRLVRAFMMEFQIIIFSSEFSLNTKQCLSNKKAFQYDAYTRLQTVRTSREHV